LVGARFGIPGMLIGAVVGAILGYDANPDQG
jgi:uncharacterized membrane protein